MSNCLYKNQFDFRKRPSTNHTLITITEKITHTLDNSHYMCEVFLDFQKAFDTVNHDMCQSFTTAVSQTPLLLSELIKLYLTCRKKYTYV